MLVAYSIVHDLFTAPVAHHGDGVFIVLVTLLLLFSLLILSACSLSFHVCSKLFVALAYIENESGWTTCPLSFHF